LTLVIEVIAVLWESAKVSRSAEKGGVPREVALDLPAEAGGVAVIAYRAPLIPRWPHLRRHF